MLRILHLEDSKTDSEFIQPRFKEEGIDCEITRFKTPNAFMTALDNGAFDLILSACKLRSFDSLTAISIANEKAPYTPFILVSGEIGEESAIEFMKKGATDHVLINNLKRLVPTVQRALREAEGRRKCARSEKTGPGIKVIFTSGYGSDIIDRKEIATDGFVYIVKPVSPNKLLTTIKEILQSGK
ncbi:MAG: hypothetical protein AB1499_07700 [Nitrospirota bacterium]